MYYYCSCSTRRRRGYIVNARHALGFILCLPALLIRHNCMVKDLDTLVGPHMGWEPGEHLYCRGAIVGCRGHMIQGLYLHRYSIFTASSAPTPRIQPSKYNTLLHLYFCYSLYYIYCSRSSIIIFYILCPFYYILIAIGYSNSYKPGFTSRY